MFSSRKLSYDIEKKSKDVSLIKRLCKCYDMFTLSVLYSQLLCVTLALVNVILLLFAAMVMADVTVLTDMWKEEEKRIKELLEKLGQQMKDHGVSHKNERRTGCRKWYTIRLPSVYQTFKTASRISQTESKSL